MGRPVKILILERCAETADLMAFQLRRAGFEPAWERVDNEKDFLARLQLGLDAIIGNGNVSEFSSLKAIEVLRKQNLLIPFILVTDESEREAALTGAESGATARLAMN